MVRSTFYITEKHGHASQIFYFRKPIWTLISKLSIHQFTNKNLIPLDRYQQATSYQNYAKLRILPKDGTFRPIMTFFSQAEARSKNSNRRPQSINQKFRECSIVLRQFKHNLPKELGYSVFDNQQISDQLSIFKQKWIQKQKPQLYYSTLDITKAFDSIDTNILLQMCKSSSLFANTYLLSMYTMLQRNGKQPNNKCITSLFRSKKRTTGINVQTMSAYDLGCQFSEGVNRHNSILINQSRYMEVTRQEILEAIQKICDKEIVINYKGNSYFQTKGIPQGLCISPILCSLYFGNIEDKYLRDGLLKQDKYKDILVQVMRMTDDYLVISDNKQVVQDVIDKLQQCAEMFQFQFNQKKQQTNIHVIENAQFLWLGKQININEFKIMPNKREKAEIFYQINVNYKIDQAKKKNQLLFILYSKLKGFLYNHYNSYCNLKINTTESNVQIFKLYSNQSALKFLPFIKKIISLKLFDDKELIQIIAKSINIVMNDFCIQSCFLLKNNNQHQYQYLFRQGIEIFNKVFGQQNIVLKGIVNKLKKSTVVRNVDW